MADSVGCNTQVHVIRPDNWTKERILKMFCDRIFVYGVDTIAAEDDKHYLPNHLVLVQIWFSNGLLQHPKFCNAMMKILWQCDIR